MRAPKASDPSVSTSILSDFFPTGALQTVNRSLVRTSKLPLYYSKPCTIWDSIVGRTFGLRYHYQITQEQYFISYVCILHEVAYLRIYRGKLCTCFRWTPAPDPILEKFHDCGQPSFRSTSSVACYRPNQVKCVNGTMLETNPDKRRVFRRSEGTRRRSQVRILCSGEQKICGRGQ
jgi:hypothetical protein